MPTKLCIFNPVTNLIDVANGVSVFSGTAGAGLPVVLNSQGALDSSFFNSSPVIATAAVNLEAGSLVNLYYATVLGVPGVYVQLASADSSNPLPAMGFVSIAYGFGDPCTVQTSGLVNVPFASGFTTSDVGQPIFLSPTTPGGAVLTEPSSPNLVQPLGYIYDVQLTTSPYYVQFPFLAFPPVPVAAGINQLTGDGIAGPGVGSQVLTLTTVNSNVGSFTNASITVDAKGRITAVANGSASGITALTGDIAASGSGSVTATLATVNSNVGTYAPAQITVNAKGLITAASNYSIPVATGSTFGTVKPDDTTITVSGGVITAVAGGGGINQLTGDATAGPGTGSQALTLATVNSNVGTFAPAQVTVNAKGLITAASNYTIPTATGSTLGIVKPDGTTITISGGVISSTRASSPNYVSEIPPTGTAPTTTYVLSFTPTFVFGVYVNGQFVYPGLGYDYTISGSTITFNYTTASGDVVFVVYVH